MPEYRFSFGLWDISEGTDPFGLAVRPSAAFGEKLKLWKQLGFEGVQFHDDAVPDLEGLPPEQIAATYRAPRQVLGGEGLVAEFLAPRSRSAMRRRAGLQGDGNGRVAHLANIAYKTGRKLRWDGQRERFIDDPEADRLLTRQPREPWNFI